MTASVEAEDRKIGGGGVGSGGSYCRKWDAQPPSAGLQILPGLPVGFELNQPEKYHQKWNAVLSLGNASLIFPGSTGIGEREEREVEAAAVSRQWNESTS